MRKTWKPADPDVRLYSDVSVTHKQHYGVAAWACHAVRGSRWFLTGSALSGRWSQNTTLLECVAAEKSLLAAAEIGIFRPGDEVVVHMDNKHSIDFLRGTSVKGCGQMRTTLEVFWWLAEINDLTVTFEKVRGHGRQAGPHGRRFDEVDVLARKLMRAELKRRGDR